MFTSSSSLKSVRAAIAGAVIALGLTGAAFAQQPNTQVIPPKQVGFWTVIGWSQGYCAAERPVQGAGGVGMTLQFVLAKLRGGSRTGERLRAATPSCC